MHPNVFQALTLSCLMLKNDVVAHTIVSAALTKMHCIFSHYSWFKWHHFWGKELHNLSLMLHNWVIIEVLCLLGHCHLLQLFSPWLIGRHLWNVAVFAKLIVKPTKHHTSLAKDDNEKTFFLQNSFKLITFKESSTTFWLNRLNKTWRFSFFCVQATAAKDVLYM